MTAADLTGTTVGAYELRDQIDNNGIILTYAAYQPRLLREVAVQTLRADRRDDVRLRQGMARGAQLMARLEHPGIVPVLDFGETERLPYIVLRSMRGGSLRTRLKSGGTFSLNEAAGIIRQLAGALDYVHTRGLVHGDPSPANIGFDESGSAYLTDFLFNGMSGEAPEIIYSSKRYTAPERWQGSASTPASDQYALACIAWELATGQPAFDGVNREAVRDRHLTALPAAPPDLPAGITPVLLRGLAKSPNERYPAVLGFARDFERAISAAPNPVFISYSRRDQSYARWLREQLQANRFHVWLDDAIEHGDQWFNQIHDAIRACAAFIVIMTPEAEASEWVQKEILLAKRYQKPIFPLLRRGAEFAILIDLQFADVRGSDDDTPLPGPDYYRRLSRAVHGVV